MYDLLERLLKRHEERTGFGPGNSIAVDGESTWAGQCLSSERAEQAPKHFGLITRLEEAVGVPAESDEELRVTRLGEPYAHQLRTWLGTQLDVSLDSVDNKSYDWRRAQRLARIGLPMHLRIVRDLTAGSQSAPRWNPDGLRLARAWGIDAIEAAWLWRHLFETKPAMSKGEASTRVMAVDDGDPSSRGAQGFSNILTVAAIPWTDEELPAHGFMPHPESFGYCLDDEFRAALHTCDQYLKDIGLWPKGIALEWNLQMKRRTPVLTGGSAGAALALVSGSLLARLQQQERKSA